MDGGEKLQVGVARCDITPPIGIAHGNWSAQVHERAEGVDLPLWCTVLAASDAHEEILIVEWDLLYPPKGEELALFRKRIGELTGVPPSHILMSASHTHSAHRHHDLKSHLDWDPVSCGPSTVFAGIH
jgi:hypothetical protein